MSLIRKKPQFKKGDFMRLAEVAELLCVDAETIRTGGVGNFTLIKLNDGKRPPILIKTAEVNAFLEHRIGVAEENN